MKYLITLFAICISSIAHSAIIDWDSQTWTPGALSKKITVSGTVIDINVTGSTSRFTDDPNGDLTPTINNIQTGGVTPRQDVLNLRLDFASPTQSVNTEFKFSTLVTGVTFQVFDIDTDSFSPNPTFGWQDKVTVTGFNGLTIVNPTVIGSLNNSVSGNVVTGIHGNTSDTSSASNATFTFNTPIDRFVLNYGNGILVDTNPIEQRISIWDVHFMPIPEPGTLILASLAVVGVYLWRRSTARSVA